ncbi:MAG TPA: hypothetical protein VNO69_01395 [Methyloceanibacter sp.]|nr:hypothetical protein [Methyloceanibacter sp.]
MIEAMFAVLMLSTPAPNISIPVEMGPGDLPLGTFCRIQDVCVIAQTEADCGKISGKTFTTLDACTSAVPAAATQQEK